MTKYLVPLFLCSLIGCNSTKKDDFTYFGGKIIHPKGCHVILSDNKGFRDTLTLTKENRFLGKYDNLREGLYVFEHGPEHQYVYLEPNDSLMFRLNTWDFDESLVFSGKNAQRNNLLIEAFLKHEEDEKFLMQSYGLEYDAYERRMDSMLAVKETIVATYVKEFKDTSKGFLDVLNIALNYPLYSNMESYATNNCHKKPGDYFGNEYYDFRDDINIKRDSLVFYGPYYRYVIGKLYNEAYLKGLESGTEGFVIDLLHNIDESIQDEVVKNTVLYRTMAYNFTKRRQGEDFTKAFFTFFKLNSSIEDKKKIQRLVNDMKLAKNKTKLSSFKIEKPTGDWEDIHKLIVGKKSVVYFNNRYYSSTESVSARFNYLVKKFPELNFVIVHQDNKAKYFKSIPIKHQYKLPKESGAHEFLSSNFPRLILVDEEGAIENGFSTMSASDIELQLDKLQKK